MMQSWKHCKKILCIRADNMGDVLMSAPAIRMLRRYTGSHISLLTSGRGAPAARLIKDIDEVVIADLPWVKLEACDDPRSIERLINVLKGGTYDGCIIFSVYSQNPMPSILLAYMAGIPLRLAYCRENPYALLTNWIPDTEPYHCIRHQVDRDMALVASIGAPMIEKHMFANLSVEMYQTAQAKIHAICKNYAGFAYIVFHTGVSEPKRAYPFDHWVACGKLLIERFRLPLLITGSTTDAVQCNALADAIGEGSYCLAGVLDLPEFAATIARAAVVVSVNTVAIHLASAFKTPVVVLYAQSNPQHTPWMTPARVLEYSFPEEYRSRNQVVDFVHQLLYNSFRPIPGPTEVADAVQQLLRAEEETNTTDIHASKSEI